MAAPADPSRFSSGVSTGSSSDPGLYDGGRIDGRPSIARRLEPGDDSPPNYRARDSGQQKALECFCLRACPIVKRRRLCLSESQPRNPGARDSGRQRTTRCFNAENAKTGEFSLVFLLFSAAPATSGLKILIFNKQTPPRSKNW